MYRDKTVAVVVPCYNEAGHIARVVETMPDLVDRIIVVDDASRDGTAAEVARLHTKHDRVFLIRHQENQGVGGAIASGYEHAREGDFDVAVVMAGDGQMDPGDLPALLDPVVSGQAD